MIELNSKMREIAFSYWMKGFLTAAFVVGVPAFCFGYYYAMKAFGG